MQFVGYTPVGMQASAERECTEGKVAAWLTDVPNDDVVEEVVVMSVLELEEIVDEDVVSTGGVELVGVGVGVGVLSTGGGVVVDGGGEGSVVVSEGGSVGSVVGSSIGVLVEVIVID